MPTRRVDADSNAQQLFANVGSYYPLGKNFRLTPEVKAKFTEKLRRDPTEFDGIKVAEVRELAGLNSSSATDHGYGIVARYRLSGAESMVCVSMVRVDTGRTATKVQHSYCRSWIQKLNAAAKA